MSDNKNNYIIDSENSINKKIYDEILLKLDKIDQKISRVNKEINLLKRQIQKLYDLKNTKSRW